MDSSNVQQTAALLCNATKSVSQFYGSDVKMAYHLMRAILQHESRQQGFNLSATQDVLFNEVRARSCSANMLQFKNVAQFVFEQRNHAYFS